MKHVYKNYLFFAGFLLFFGFIHPAVSLADSTVFTGYKLPHALPWNDGTDTWTQVRAYQSSGSFHAGTGSGTWIFYYHNEGNLYVNCNPNSTCPAGSNVIRNANDGTGSYSGFIGTYTCRPVTVTNVLDSTNTFTDGAKVDYTTSSGCSNAGMGSNTCQYRHFSVGGGIYAISPSSTSSWDLNDTCEDTNTIFETGDLVIPRVNLSTDGVTIIGSPSPAPSLIINSDTSEYVTVPDLLSDPSGFVAALLTNLGIWLYNLVVPDSEFLADSYANIRTLFETKFAFYFQIRDAFVVPTATSMTPISLGSLHIGGTTLAPITFISSFDPAEFASFRAFLSMVLYVGLGFFIIRRMSNIFSS